MRHCAAHASILLNHSDAHCQVMLGKRRVTICVTQYMQYLFRVKNGYCAENWKLRAKLRHNFWRALNAYKNSPNYVDVYLGSLRAHTQIIDDGAPQVHKHLQT